MNANPVKTIQIQWWSAPLAVLFTVVLFFILDNTRLSEDIHPVIRTLMLSTVSVIMLWGINMFYGRTKNRRTPP